MKDVFANQSEYNESIQLALFVWQMEEKNIFYVNTFLRTQWMSFEVSNEIKCVSRINEAGKLTN